MAWYIGVHSAIRNNMQEVSYNSITRDWAPIGELEILCEREREHMELTCMFAQPVGFQNWKWAGNTSSSTALPHIQQKDELQ